MKNKVCQKALKSLFRTEKQKANTLRYFLRSFWFKILKIRRRLNAIYIAPTSADARFLVLQIRNRIMLSCQQKDQLTELHCLFR